MIILNDMRSGANAYAGGKHAAFTLVELIVVIVILSILSTIAFLSFSSQSASARDSTRLSDLSNISKGLMVFNAVAGKYPAPENPMTISSSGVAIGLQGYAGSDVLRMIKLSDGGGKDPLDAGTYYTYSTNINQKKFQLLGFLEDRNSRSTGFKPGLGVLGTSLAEPASYSGRYTYTRGDMLGILLDDSSQLPVQAKRSASFTGVDITNTDVIYGAVLDNNEANMIRGTGAILGILEVSLEKRSPKSCKEILDARRSTGDGIYAINPTGTGSIKAYCDMTTNGGGWTLLTRQIGGLTYTGNIIFDDFTNSLNSHYGIRRSPILSIIDGRSEIQGYYKHFSSGGVLDQEIASKLHNLRGNYVALGAGDKIFTAGTKDDSAFVLLYAKDTGNDFYEPKSICGVHTQLHQYWYDNYFGLFADNGLQYFATYDGCTGDTLNQGSTVANTVHSTPRVTNSGKYQEVYIR